MGPLVGWLETSFQIPSKSIDVCDFFVYFPYPCIYTFNSHSFVVFSYISETFSVLHVHTSGSLVIGMYILRDFLSLNAFKMLFLLRGAAAWSVRQRCLKHNTNVFLKLVEIPCLDSHWSGSVTPCCRFPVTLRLVSKGKSFLHSLISCSDSQQKAKPILKKLFPECLKFQFYIILFCGSSYNTVYLLSLYYSLNMMFLVTFSFASFSEELHRHQNHRPKLLPQWLTS